MEIGSSPDHRGAACNKNNKQEQQDTEHRTNKRKEQDTQILDRPSRTAVRIRSSPAYRVGGCRK